MTILTFLPTADLLGPLVENLGDLLRMPYGCGEQNMLYFAPNVFLIIYLQRTDTYTPEVAEKAENYMLVGALAGWVMGESRCLLLIFAIVNLNNNKVSLPPGENKNR